jgi:S1-C subfamily serine protease
MKRVLAALLAAVLFYAAPCHAASLWNPIADKVSKSIVFVQVADMGSCTAFVINEKENLVLTANHCFGTDVEAKDILVDNSPAKLIARDKKHDLMVLYVKGLNKPAIHLAKGDPSVGDEVASYGFGLGLEHPLFRVSHVSDVDTTIDGSGLPEHLIAVDTQFVPGQSGGPVVDTDGNLVMIVEAGGSGIGLGPGADMIKKQMGRYFESAK